MAAVLTCGPANASGGINHNNGTDFDIQVGGSEKMRVGTNGNVGIGTTSPKTTLDVNGYLRLKKNSSAPFTCDAAHDGTIALNRSFTYAYAIAAVGLL